MNVEIADRLVKLRKEYGYSQEELALKLGISRQAVSKWERAESSPDTDNLICLAKLYNVSLDELLNTNETLEQIKEEQVIKTEEVIVNDSENDKKEVVTKSYIKFKKRLNFFHRVDAAIPIIITLVYLLLGLTWDLWHPTWYLFILIPVIASFLEAIAYKDPHKFYISILFVFIYFVVSTHFDLWGTGWFVLLLTPIYYIVVPHSKYEAVEYEKDGVIYKDFRLKETNENNYY